MRDVRKYMTAEVETLSPEDTLQDAVRLEMRLKIRHMPVVEGMRLLGIVTDRDLRRAMPSVLSGTDREHFEKLMEDTKIGQIMTRAPQTISPDAPLREAVEVMFKRKYGALPVVDGDKLIGIITQIDLLRALLELLEEDFY